MQTFSKKLKFSLSYIRLPSNGRLVNKKYERKDYFDWSGELSLTEQRSQERGLHWDKSSLGTGPSNLSIQAWWGRFSSRGCLAESGASSDFDSDFRFEVSAGSSSTTGGGGGGWWPRGSRSMSGSNKIMKNINRVKRFGKKVNRTIITIG